MNHQESQNGIIQQYHFMSGLSQPNVYEIHLCCVYVSSLCHFIAVQSQLIHSPVHGDLSSFQVLEIMNKGAVKTLLYAL